MTDTDSQDTPRPHGDDEPATGGRPPRWLIALGAVAGLLALVIVGARVLVATPPGRALIESRLDGLGLGPVGTLSLEGLGGDLLSSARVARLSIADDDGVWLEAEDVAVRWRPLALRRQQVSIDSLEAARLAVHRQPTLEPDDSDEDDGDSGWSVRLGAADLPRIELGEELIGQDAVLAASGGLDTGPGGTFALAVDARRTDEPGDVLDLRAERGASGRIDADATLTAPAGGPLAELLRTGGRTLEARATAAGSLSEGEANVSATLDAATVLAADGEWTEAGGRVDATAALGEIPMLSALAERLGDSLDATVTFGEENGGVRDVALEATSDALGLAARGAIDVTEWTAAEGLTVEAEAARLDRLIGLDDPDLALGAARVTGTLRAETAGGDPVTDLRALTALEDVLVFAGDVAAEDLGYGDWGAERVEGPVAARYDGASGRVAVETDGLEAADVAAPEAAADLLGDTVRLAFAAAFDPATGALSVADGTVETAAGVATLSASYGLEDGALEADVAADLADAGAAPQVAGGTARLEARVARAGSDAPFAVEARLSGDAIAMEEPTLDALVGATPSLDLVVDVEGSTARITRARLEGARLLVEGGGAAGPEQGFDLDFDATAEGPVALGPVALDGALVAAARLEGPFDAPRLRADARAPELAVPGVVFLEPRLRAELNDLTGALSGTVAFDAETDEGPAAASADIAQEDGAFVVSNASASWRDVTATGRARVPEDGPINGDVSLAGLDGRLAVDAQVALEGGTPMVQAEAVLRQQPIGAAGQLEALTFSATGPLDGLDLAVAAQGYAAGEFDFEAVGAFEQSDDSMRLTLTPRGTFADVAVTAPRPWTLTMSDDETRADAELSINGGGLDASLVRAAGMTTLTADLTDAPLSLVNLVRPDPPLEGTVSGEIDLEGAERLEGTVRLAIENANAPELARAADLDLSVTLDQGTEGAQLTATARDGAGFMLDASGQAPIVMEAWPPLPRFDRDAPVEGSATLEGDIAALWALVGSAGRSLAGVVDAEGTIAGTLNAPELSGVATLRDGLIEDAQSGLRITDASARARLEGPRLVIESLQARDSGEGRLTGDGAVEFGGEPGSETRIAIDLRGFQLVNSEAVSGVASGGVTLTRLEDIMRLEGDVTIDRAEIATPEGGGGAAGVPTLNVEEVNRPDDLTPPPSAQSTPVELALVVTAPRRIFIRGQGLDTEWGFNARIEGTTDEPEIYGSATLIRGDLTIAGERFTLSSAEITFDGDVSEAEIDLTAERQNADLAVIAHITGSAASPSIELRSTPSYPEGEILARMLYGRSASELSPLEAAQLASALASLAGGGGGGFDLLGPLREGLGVDRLSIRTSEAGTPLVAGGRYLSEDVYLEVSSAATGMAQASIEWEIRPRLDLISRFGGGEDTGVSLRWRYDY